MITLRNNLIGTFAILATSFCAATAAFGAGTTDHESFLARPDTAEKAPDADGFIQRWIILDPVSSRGLTDSVVQAAVQPENRPGPLTVVPKDGDTVSSLTWHAVDTTQYNLNLYYFASAYGKQTSNVLFWAVTVIDCPEEMKDVRLAIGSNAASVWWVNGEEVIGIYNDRQTVVDDGVSRRLTLKKGPNVVYAAIVNAGGATDFCARFLDSEGEPLKGFTVNLSGAEE
jgi:hypothetical protein